ncbi:MAG: FMN-dependent NADH-azoreductase [Pseudonocardiaceae bacterium]
MKKLLHVNASPRGPESHSLALATELVNAYRERRPDVALTTLNLFDDPLPPFGSVAAAAKMAAFSGQSLTAEQVEIWERARAVFDQFEGADAYVFNVPMWNAGVPYVLKQWIDIVTQPGWAFGFDPTEGYTGLVTGKKAAIVYTSGVYTPGVPLEFGADFHSTFFNDWLRFVGIVDVSEIRLSGNALAVNLAADLEAAGSRAREIAEEFAGHDLEIAR